MEKNDRRNTRTDLGEADAGGLTNVYGNPGIDTKLLSLPDSTCQEKELFLVFLPIDHPAISKKHQ